MVSVESIFSVLISVKLKLWFLTKPNLNKSQTCRQNRLDCAPKLLVLFTYQDDITKLFRLGESFEGVGEAGGELGPGEVVR